MAIILLIVFYKIVSRLLTDVVATLSTTPESERLLSIKRRVCETTFLAVYDPSKAKAHLLKSYFGTSLVSSLPDEDFRFSDLGFEVSFSSALISLKSDLTWELELFLGRHFLFTFALQSRRSVSLKKSEDFFLMSRTL